MYDIANDITLWSEIYEIYNPVDSFDLRFQSGMCADKRFFMLIMFFPLQILEIVNMMLLTTPLSSFNYFVSDTPLMIIKYIPS